LKMPTNSLSQIHKSKVLLVDDESEVLQVVGEILEMTGDLEVHGALSVAEGFDLMKEEQFDVIVSDYQMPEKDGLEFLRELKEKGNEKPFVMFTGKGKEQVAVEARKLGAFEFVNKNGQHEIVYSQLIAAIHEATQN
jgi:DNA-binding NtrC family response regulator